MAVEITYDEALIKEIAARFDLRTPNENALREVVRSIAEAGGSFREIVADLATGVGKTFLMSSFVEYLAHQGVRHVLVVTPGSTIQRKTLANFDAASTKYVSGADIAPVVVTPENFQTSSTGTLLRDPGRLKVFVFNVQQLIRPTDKTSRKVRAEDENLGNALYSHLEQASDLFIVADEHHIYHDKAKAFAGAVRDLHPIALVGLTATPDQEDYSKIVFQYTLGEAIADGHVKVPVIVYRKDGTKDIDTQLRDACQLLGNKERSYTLYSETDPDATAVKPVMFVVCRSIEHASEIGQVLAGPGFIGDPNAVLEITSQSSDEALEALSQVESPDSPIRAIVSVNMLREGWDVKNIAVIVALRRLASQTLTEQILGRGLRLPFGSRTGMPDVDQVDLVAHDSYEQLLSQKDVLRQRIQLPPTSIEVDEHGAATTAVLDSTEPDDEDATNADPSLRDETAGLDQNNLFGGTGMLADFDVTDSTENSSRDNGGHGPALGFRETEARLNVRPPEVRGRVDDAPQIIFPRRESDLIAASFSLADVPDGDAQAAGARFIREVPTFIFREALEAEREGENVKISRVPLANEEALEPQANLDVVRVELVHAVLQQPEVPKEKASKNGAKRLVEAFLKGAGVTKEASGVEWGQKRSQQAVQGMKELIRAAVANRRQERTFSFVPSTLPVEPVVVPSESRHAYNDNFVKNTPFVGWKKNVMPVASFDAGSTEWELAHMLDRDNEIAWWLRLYVGGPAFILTEDGAYFPDFIAIAEDGTYWLIEGKSDKNAKDADVLGKKAAGATWARAVRDNGEFGTWRYMFATETHIKHAGGSWAALMVETDPE